ncbi:hypothetical protein BDU57DRAFT_532247 [Ampelomyces quisqualis]|uniref:Uncharacterized protein n=1 Tax=Ampelomyces quisqualis TaxID=50730 RepID=A0A6A5QC77_AMPQU|nr:hypothetical protein BDU57DRAFT_532247 [Ampelomyces quisqualis]
MAVGALATSIAPSSSKGHRPSYSLRANCPNEPWHGRHLVALPTSHQLGLENFTVSPTTPSSNFRPVEIGNGNYALRVDGHNDNPSKLSYLAALKSTTGTRTVSMAVVYASRPHYSANYLAVESCPAGYECVIDQWTFDEAESDMVYPNFRYAGFNGEWEPFKDAAPEGWHVYWKGNAGLHHPIRLDLTPLDDERRFATDSHP